MDTQDASPHFTGKTRLTDLKPNHLLIVPQMPQRLRTRPLVPREIAPGIYATTNQLIIDASKQAAAHNTNPPKGENNPEEGHPTPTTNENDEEGGTQGHAVSQ